MNSKQRGVVLQRWSGVIGREARDLDSLEQIARRALADSDVRDDRTLQDMIRAEVQKRRSALEQKSRDEESTTTPPQPRPSSRSDLPDAAPTTTPGQDRETFDRLVRTLGASLERNDENDARAILGRMRALQEQRPALFSVDMIEGYEQQVGRLRVHVQQLSDEIAALAQRAVSAAERGSEQDLKRAMGRLTAIHAAHPVLLDEPGLEDVRREVAAAAAERRQHQRTTEKLLERERAIAAGIKKLASAVRDFHQVASRVPETSEEFRQAEARYLQTSREVRTYDTDWFSGIVLDLADLLAEWTVPPPGAEGQIDRFLDSISNGLNSIRAEMRQIRSEQESGEGGSTAR